MDQGTLFREARQLLNFAAERHSAGEPLQAQARLEELRDLLNLAHADKSADDEKIEETLDASEG